MTEEADEVDEAKEATGSRRWFAVPPRCCPDIDFVGLKTSLDGRCNALGRSSSFAVSWRNVAAASFSQLS